MTEWRGSLRAKLEELVDGFVVNGAKQAEVFEAIVAEVGRLRAALEIDPDPAEDEAVAIEEPAHDWPAAQKD
jgi:hypothetical protein